MTPSDTIDSMPVQGRPTLLTPRELAAKAAKDLISYSGMSLRGAGRIADNLAPRTVSRLVAGDPAVVDSSWQALAGVLHLPVNLFLMIIDEDRAGIAALTLPVHVRDHLVLLGILDATPTNRRHTNTNREDLAKG